MKASNTEDEIGDIQKKLTLLEGERKNYYESSRNKIRENKEILLKLKRENKELRAQLALAQREASKNNNLSAGEADLARIDAEVTEMRKYHDSVKIAAARAQREVTILTDKLKDITKESIRTNSDETPLARQIRTLESRLDKAMIKYNEAQSIRKTYEQIVRRLKEERIGFDNQLMAIERTLKAKEHDLEELVLMSHDATHAKEVGKAELAKLDVQLSEERKLREREVEERRQLVKQKVDMNQRMEKREKMRRDIQMEATGELSGEQENGLKKNIYSAPFHSNVDEKKLEAEQKVITDFEEAFRKIKDATGVTDVNEVIQKFLTQDETHNNLVAMTKEAQSKIEMLNEDKLQAKAKVEEIKYSGTGALGSRRIVDEFESHLSEANAKCERNKQKYERIAKILINVKAGVEHLADMLEPVKIDQVPVMINDDTVVEVMGHCENKLMRLVEHVDVGEGGTAASTEEVAVPAKDSRPPEMPQHNIRIAMGAKDRTQEDDGEELDDEDQEDVPDRESVKKFSAVVMEKANKKTKRKVRRTKSPSRPSSADKKK